MKTIYLILMSCIVFATATWAQNISVPANVSNAFKTKFPGATNVKWGKESAKEYEAEFKLNKTDVSANFRSDGSWVETETKIPIADLPAAASNAVKTKYPGAVITGAEKVEVPGKTNYEVGFKVNNKKKSAELNAEGKFVE